MGTLSPRGLGRGDWFEPAETPDAPPPHSSHCAVHELDYRTAYCPKCADVAREARAQAALARIRVSATEQQLRRQANAKAYLTPEMRAEIGRRSVEGRAAGEAQRRGGINGGHARAENLSPERRREIATKASHSRAAWKRRMAETGGGKG